MPRLGYYGLPTLAISDALPVIEPAEGAPKTYATFTVSLSAPSSDQVTVDYATVNGSADAGIDYTATQATLSFAPGTTVQRVQVEILADNINEGAENFSVTLSDPTNAGIADGVGLATILDKDPNLSLGNLLKAYHDVISNVLADVGRPVEIAEFYHILPYIEDSAGDALRERPYHDHSIVPVSPSGLTGSLLQEYHNVITDLLPSSSTDLHIGQFNPNSFVGDLLF